MNITEYVRSFGNKRLTPYNMNESDVLVLTALSYMDFSMVSKYWDKPMTLKEAITRMFAYGLSQRNAEFMKNIMESERFSEMKIYGYREEHEHSDIALQFSVLTISINDNLHFISYSGTDGTIVGWKEDFQFAYLPQTEAQKKALSYLEEAADTMKGNFIISGHSKGGNLASYAAIFASPEIQGRINSIYCNDSPGFNESISIYSRESFYNICNKIHCIVPQDSLIGQLLEIFPDDRYRIVNSKADNLLYQHDIFNWQIRDSGEPEWRNELNYLSKLGMKKLNHRIRSLSMKQRQELTEAIFDVLESQKILHVDAIKYYLPVRFL